MKITIDDHVLSEHISYSQFNTYVSCGWQYYLSRILHLDEEPAVWSIGGSSFHLACENWDRENL